MSPVAQALVRLIEVLDRMEVRYALAGSVASSAHGTPRTTMDVDLVVDLRKLEWYRAGGETSQQQWSDLRGIFKSAGPQLGITYLRRWAAELQVADLLEKLLAESGPATV